MTCAPLAARLDPAYETGFRSALAAFIRGRTADQHDSEDIVQETYLRLYSYRVERPVVDVKAFCFAIARNLIRDRARVHGRATYLAIPEDLACPRPLADEIVAYRRAVELLVTSLGDMPPLRREVFLRKRLDGDSTATIAADLDMSLAAVEKHVVRALGNLRSYLVRHGFTMSGGG